MIEVRTDSLSQFLLMETSSLLGLKELLLLQIFVFLKQLPFLFDYVKVSLDLGYSCSLNYLKMKPQMVG